MTNVPGGAGDSAGIKDASAPSPRQGYLAKTYARIFAGVAFGDKPNPILEPRGWARGFLATHALVALILIVAVQFSLPPGRRWLGVAVFGVCAASALAIGGLLGFLFASPRSGAQIANARYVPNTNLEQISDWLTKIIVGLGLVQAKAIGSAFGALTVRASNAISGTADYVIAVGGLLIYMGTVGFMVGYVQVRVAFPLWFLAADQHIADLKSAADARESSPHP